MADNSLWRSVTPAGESHAPLDGDIRADAVVVGAGFTGLSTAWHLAGHGLDVVVLEAVDIGYGASGRNNGQVIPVMTRADPDILIERFGETGERFVNLIGGSAGYLFDLVRQAKLECEAEQNGWIQPAHTPGRMHAISANRHRQWQRAGAEVELLDKADIERLTGSPFFHGGFMNRTGGHINPLALARELGRSAAERSVRIFENSPVNGYAQTADGWRVESDNGAVEAKALVLATNAYSGEIRPALASKMARSIVPVMSWQMATQPLSDNVRQSVIPGRQAVSDTQGDLHFFRYDARNRLVTGGALVLPFNKEQRIKARIIKRLQKVFPQFTEPRIEQHWTGYVGMTRDHTPHFHKLGPNGWAWIGCNGRGVALSVSLGWALADAIAGPEGQELPFPVTDIEPIPFQGLARRVAPPFTLSYYRWRDQREMR
ncbi:MAG: FAD-binding oxidoreductase [Alphaproteobacteria bacterium]|nr:FAD-binding oxidoreductase [Alphaproteobacteria bacterium]